MKKLSEKKELLKLIRGSRRLVVKPPKSEVPKNLYNRKSKHKRSLNGSSFSFNR